MTAKIQPKEPKRGKIFLKTPKNGRGGPSEAPFTRPSRRHYLDDNPRRLWLKRTRPDLFTVQHSRELGGVSCQLVGNLFLLDRPEKEAVIVHRRTTAEELRALRMRWLSCAKGGGVLVSAAIAPAEKEVLRAALEAGYGVILLRDNGFPPYYKPSGEAFDACLSGRLLQVSPWPHTTRRTAITREQCLFLNALAVSIAGGGAAVTGGSGAASASAPARSGPM